MMETHNLGTTRVSQHEVWIPANAWDAGSGNGSSPTLTYDNLIPAMEDRPTSERFQVVCYEFSESEDAVLQYHGQFGDCRRGIAVCPVWLAPRFDVSEGEDPIRYREEAVVWKVAAVGIGPGDKLSREFGPDAVAISTVLRSEYVRFPSGARHPASPWDGNHAKDVIIAPVTSLVEVPASQAEFTTFIRLARAATDERDTMRGTVKFLGAILKVSSPPV